MDQSSFNNIIQFPDTPILANFQSHPTISSPNQPNPSSVDQPIRTGVDDGYGYSFTYPQSQNSNGAAISEEEYFQEDMLSKIFKKSVNVSVESKNQNNILSDKKRTKLEEKINSLIFDLTYLNDMKVIDKKLLMKDRKVKVQVFNIRLYQILVRESYKGIYNDIVETVINAKMNQETLAKFLQCCFLIYGNKAIGKTALFYYLSYMFKEDNFFSDYDIIIFNRKSEENSIQKCYVRYGGEEEKNYIVKNRIPAKRKNNPTIVISDNIEIREDDFSENDIIIMISSPDAEIYKIFRNKREPTQYCIPQIKGDELKQILHLYNHDSCLDRAKQFGGNLVYTFDDKITVESLVDGDGKEKELHSYMSGKYDEKMYIYDTDDYKTVPKYLRFLSVDIEKMALAKYYFEKEKIGVLLDIFDNTRDGFIFERIVHLLLGYGEIKLNDKRNLKACKTKVFLHRKDDINAILGALDLDEQYYFDFSSKGEFPGIDGLIVDGNSMCAVQMTLRDRHPTKGNVIVFLTVLLLLLFIYYLFIIRCRMRCKRA